MPLTLIIASQRHQAYFAVMRAKILKLLSLLALVLMPFGMSAAMAAPGHQQPAAANAEHCGEHGGQPAEKSAKQSADCAMACSMLMATETRIDEPEQAVRLVPARPLAERGTGLHPDTATPPPKFA